jgi:N-acetylmuramoyl-L-alanine amidase
VRKKLLILLIFACASTTGLLAAIGYCQTDAFISIDASALPKQGHSGLAVVYLSGDTRRAEKEGTVFEIVKAADNAGMMSSLSAVLDAWLQSKGQSEKAFSVGRFEPEYLA